MTNDSTHAKRYLNLILMQLWRDGTPTRRLDQGQPLPHAAMDLALSPPDFDQLLNRLKVLCDLDPVRFQQPRTGTFELLINSQPAAVRVEFDDTPGKRSVTIRLARQQAAA